MPTPEEVAAAQTVADAAQAHADALQATAIAKRVEAEAKRDAAAASGDPSEMAEATAAATQAAALQDQADRARARADAAQAHADDLAAQAAIESVTPPTSTPSPTAPPAPPAPPPAPTSPTAPAPPATTTTLPAPTTTAPPTTSPPASGMGSASSMQHVRLLVLEAKVAGKSASVGAQVDEIGFSINPKEMSLTTSAEWKSKPAKKPQPAEYTGVKPTAVQFEVLFDEAVHGSPISPPVRKLMDLVKPLQQSAATNPRPPFVQIWWGEVVSIIYIVKQVQVKITRFGANGMPIRATATLQLEEAMVEMPRQNPTSGGPAGRRVHTATAGDTLASIATAEYGDPRQWRTIAAVNGVDDPMRLLPGTRLMLPRSDDLPVNP